MHHSFILILVFINIASTQQQLPTTTLPSITTTTAEPSISTTKEEASTKSIAPLSSSTEFPSVATTIITVFNETTTSENNTFSKDSNETFSTFPVKESTSSVAPTIQYNIKCYVYAIKINGTKNQTLVSQNIVTGCNDKCCMIFDGEKTKKNELIGTAFGYCGCNSTVEEKYGYYTCDTNFCNSYDTLREKINHASTFTIFFPLITCILSYTVLNYLW